MKTQWSLLPSLVLGACLATSAHAQLVRISAGDFTPEASVITFDGGNMFNPTYDVVTATLGTVTVSFGSNFAGQSLIGGFPATLSGNPSGPLTLLNDANVFITNDGSNPSSPVLSGSPTFNGPISVLFSKPVAAVGLDGGYFDAIGGTSIEAFGANGASLGIVKNAQLGIEFFGLADASGDNVIAGISFYITGDEPAGFAIDNLTFGSAGELTNPPDNGGMTPIPEPSTYAAFASLGLILLAVRRMRRQANSSN